MTEIMKYVNALVKFLNDVLAILGIEANITLPF